MRFDFSLRNFGDLTYWRRVFGLCSSNDGRSSHSRYLYEFPGWFGGSSVISHNLYTTTSSGRTVLREIFDKVARTKHQIYELQHISGAV